MRLLLTHWQRWKSLLVGVLLAHRLRRLICRFLRSDFRLDFCFDSHHLLPIPLLLAPPLNEVHFREDVLSALGITKHDRVLGSLDNGAVETEICNDGSELIECETTLMDVVVDSTAEVAKKVGMIIVDMFFFQVREGPLPT